MLKGKVDEKEEITPDRLSIIIGKGD